MTATSDREARSTVRPAAYSPRRIALTVVLVVAFMALGLVAGRWQWGRYETRAHALDAQELAAGLPTVSLASVLTTDDPAPGDADWRIVTEFGVIDPSDVLQLRGRSVDGTASIQYVAWIHDVDGHTVLLNLGWTPRANPQAPHIPEGPVTVTGTVRSFETDNGRKGTRINPTQMGGIDGEVFQAYLMVDSACGADGCLTGVEPVPLPQLSTGPHLSYAMQWWLLLVASAPVGVWLTVRDARLERERLALSPASQPGGSDAGARSSGSPTSSGSATNGGGEGSETRRPPAKRARPSDEEIEDAL